MEDRFNSIERWQMVLDGNHDAFEEVVIKYQAAVSAVAYCVTGNFTHSQDIAQETFLIAWRTRDQLVQPEQLGAWLCGIARNLSKQQIQSNRRSHATPMNIDQVTDSSSNPLLKSITAEEQVLVQEALEAMPETYREAMILFYRQGESIADVADCLGLSPEAVRQRLSRGRSLLRDRLLYLVKETLTSTRPSKAFTQSVMAAIGSLSLVSHVAQAAVPTTVAGAASLSAGKAALGGGVSAGIFSSLGGLLGLGGAWLGQWFHVQMVDSVGERALAREYGRRAFFLAALFILSLLLLSPLNRIGFPYGTIAYYLLLALSYGLFQWQLMKSWRAKERKLAELRQANGLGAENETWVRRAFQLDSHSKYEWRGREFQSQWRWLDLPVLDIQISAPSFRYDRPRKTARGWIAIGDEAHGRLLAMGEVATGLIAIGGRAKGLLAFGGFAMGGIAIGGIAIGGVCFGGLSIGVVGFGGLSVGGVAVGGVAIALYQAIGSIAIAGYDAMGTVAVSANTASGWNSYALINADGPERALEYQRIVRKIQPMVTKVVIIATFVIAGIALPLAIRLVRRR